MKGGLINKFKGEILSFAATILVLYLVIFFSIRILNIVKDLDSDNFVFVSLGKESCSFPEEGGTLIISRIGVNAPFVFPDRSDGQYIDDLDKGVTVYPGSATPGKAGLSILLGHSAPPGWPDVNYDKVFSDLGRLNPGDKVVLKYGGCRYDYRVQDTIFLDKGEEIPDYLTNQEKSALLLVSCWPPGQDYRRIGVVAERED